MENIRFFNYQELIECVRLGIIDHIWVITIECLLEPALFFETEAKKYVMKEYAIWLN